MTKEQQGATSYILRSIVQVGVSYQSIQGLSVALELRAFEIIFQELRNDLVFRNPPKGSQPTKPGEILLSLRASQDVSEKGDGNHYQQHNHHHELYQHHLLQGSVVAMNADDQNAAEGQLYPCGIGDPVGHLVGNHYHAQRIHTGGGGVKSQQIGKAVFAGGRKLRAKQLSPDPGGSQPQTESQGTADSEHQKKRNT